MEVQQTSRPMKIAVGLIVILGFAGATTVAAYFFGVDRGHRQEAVHSPESHSVPAHVEVQPPKPEIVLQPTGPRFQIIYKADIRADTWLLDTQEGRVWRSATYADYEGQPSVWKFEPRFDSVTDRREFESQLIEKPIK